MSDKNREILLGEQGNIKNNVMFLGSFGEETYNELVFKGVISEGTRMNAFITDMKIIKAFLVKQAVLNRYGVNIEYKWLWKMVSDERYDNIWKDVSLYEFGDNYEDEMMLELYADVSYVKYETSREVGTLLYDMDFDGTINEYEIVGHTATMYKVKSTDPQSKFEKKYQSGTTWYTRRGAVRSSMERIETLKKSIAKYRDAII